MAGSLKKAMGDDEPSQENRPLCADGGSRSERYPIAGSPGTSRKCDAGIRIATFLVTPWEMALKFPSLFWR